MRKKTYFLFKIFKGAVRLLYPKTAISGTENLPPAPYIVVGNHTQLHSPIVCELFLDDSHYTWCASEMMKLKEVPPYAYRDFWSQKPVWSRWFYKAVSFLIAPISVVVFNSARTVAVYKDRHVLHTFRDSVSLLRQNKNIVIFPEHDQPHNHIVNDFQEGFVDLAKLYHKRTGVALCFVPMYVAPRLKQACFSAPITFDPEAPIDDERKRICDHLKQQITSLALSLPEHTVVPYRNIPKKYYPTNTQEVNTNASTRS